MALLGLCAPALIYLIFSLTQITIDTSRGLFNTAFVKMWVAIIFTVLLNFLCMSGLGIVSWIIVFVPFVLMTVIVTMLLFTFGLNPRTGKIGIYNVTQAGRRQPPHDYRKDRRLRRKHRRHDGPLWKSDRDNLERRERQFQGLAQDARIASSTVKGGNPGAGTLGPTKADRSNLMLQEVGSAVHSTLGSGSRDRGAPMH